MRGPFHYALEGLTSSASAVPSDRGRRDIKFRGRRIDGSTVKLPPCNYLIPIARGRTPKALLAAMR